MILIKDGCSVGDLVVALSTVDPKLKVKIYVDGEFVDIFGAIVCKNSTEMALVDKEIFSAISES